MSPFGTKGDASERSEIAGVCPGRPGGRADLSWPPLHPVHPCKSNTPPLAAPMVAFAKVCLRSYLHVDVNRR